MKSKMITASFLSLVSANAFAGAPAFGVECKGAGKTTFSMSAEGCTSEFHLKVGGAKGIDLVTTCSSKPEEAVLVSQNAKTRFFLAATSEVSQAPGVTDQLVLSGEPGSFVPKSNEQGVERYEFRGTVTHFSRRDGVKSSRSYRVSCEAESIFDF